eukprot:SAG31_NODE_7079_length_1794_cov_1.755752_2_plen_394_part_01
MDLSGATTGNEDYNAFLSPESASTEPRMSELRMSVKETCSVKCIDNEDPQLKCPSQIDTAGTPDIDDDDTLFTYTPESFRDVFNLFALQARDNSGISGHSGISDHFIMMYTGTETYGTETDSLIPPDPGCRPDPDPDPDAPHLHINLQRQHDKVELDKLIPGGSYRIMSVGTTNFEDLGASENTVNITFIANGPGDPDETGEVIAESLMHSCSDWDLLPDDFKFPLYTPQFLRFYVVDAARRETYCQFSVLPKSKQLWKREVNFEGVQDSDCDTPHGSGNSITPTMTCLGQELTDNTVPLCFGSTCTDLESASYLHEDPTPVSTEATADIRVGAYSSHSWPLSYTGNGTGLNFSTVWAPTPLDLSDDNTGMYTGENEVFDCDDIGVVHGESEDG